MNEIYSGNSPQFLIEYAKTLQENFRDIGLANKKWQRRLRGSEEWSQLPIFSYPCFDEQIEYRINPKIKTITINGIELPAPMREVPAVGGYCFVLGESGVKKYKWASEAADIYSPLATGRAFETEEDAQKVFDALTKVLKGEA